MKIYNTPLEHIFLVQKHTEGDGWVTVGVTEYRHKAEEAAWELTQKGCWARVEDKRV